MGGWTFTNACFASRLFWSACNGAKHSVWDLVGVDVEGSQCEAGKKYPRLINRAMIVGGFNAVATRRKGPAGNAREDEQGIAPDGEGDNQDQQIVKDWVSE